MKKQAVTVTDIARMLNLSPSTVSRALQGVGRISPATRERVQRTADKLGYVPNIHAQRLLGGPVQTLGICSSKGFSVPYTDYYMLELLQNLLEASAEVDYGLQYLHTGDSRKLQQMLATRQIDGLIIIVDNTVSCRRLATRLAPYPCVLIGHPAHAFRPGISTITIDAENGSWQATRHLLDLGHTSIGFIRGVPGNPRRDDKYEGYIKALSSAGIKPNPELVVNSGGSIEGAIQVSEQLIHRGITATLCETDLIALGHLHVANIHGIHIPESLSIVGFNDSAFSSYVIPSLTTVRIPRVRMARKAVAMLLDLIHARVENDHAVIETELIHRSSTAPLHLRP
jgi:DNA-binding LacI/PurR family transcriptional regulator